MLPLCLPCLSLLSLIWLLTQSINADVATLNGDIISVDSAHNVFVNGIEVLTRSPTPTSTLSSRFFSSTTAASSGYSASGIGDGVINSIRGHTSGIFNHVISRSSPVSTGEPARFTRSSEGIDSSSGSDRFNARSTAFTTGNSADMVEAPRSRSTKHASNIDNSSQYLLSVSSNNLSATGNGVGYSLGHDNRHTSSSSSNKEASQFSITRTRSFATLTQDHGNTSLVSSATARANAASIIRTHGGTVLDASLTSSTDTNASLTTEPVTASSTMSSMEQHLGSGHINVNSTSLSLSTSIGSAVSNGSFTRSISSNSLTSGSRGFTISPPLTPRTTNKDSSTSHIESRAGIASRTSSGNTPDATLSSEATVPISPLKSATAATASSIMVGHNSQPSDSSNHDGGGGVVVFPGNFDTGGSDGSGSKQPKDASNPENPRSNANSMEKPSTSAESQSQLASSTLASVRSFATSYTSNTRSAQTSTSAISRTGTPISNSSVASVSTSCATCSTCLNIHFSPTTTPDPFDDDSNDDLLKRRFIDRLEKRAAGLAAKIVAKQCIVATYTKKPSYPAPRNVVSNERKPAREMTAFFATATYWAIPTPATCNGVPGWTYMNTPQIRALTPSYVLGGNTNPYVSVDHVYEVSLLEQFFIDQVAGGFTCSDVTTLFDVVDSISAGTRLNTIFGQLASYSNPDLVGMDDALNKFKGSLWNPNLHGWHGVNSTDATIKDYIQELGNLGVAMSLVNEAKVLSLFSNTNARIYQAFLGIDHVITHAVACGNSINDAAGIPMSASWGSAYKAWMTAYVAGQNALITHTASMYSAAIPITEPAYSQFIDSFNQRYGGAGSLTFPLPQIWPNSPLAMQKRDADCTPAQPTTASPTLPTSTFGDTKKSTATPAASHPSLTTTSTHTQTTQPTTASPIFATSSFSPSRKPTITPAATLPSSMTTSTHGTATIVDQDDRICDNEATGEVGPCDQVGGIMIGRKSSSAPRRVTPSAKTAPKGQDPQICDNPSAAEAAGPCAQAAGIVNGTEPGTTTSTQTVSSTRSLFPSVLTMERGGPQGGLVPPAPLPDSGDSGSGPKYPCDPGSPLEILCGL